VVEARRRFHTGRETREMTEPDNSKNNSKNNSNTDPKQDREPENRNGAIAGLVIAIALLAVGIWLARDLTAASKLQDCVMSGRTNCNVIEPAR
jgi:hypothetical protein